jgi:site-specific DNA recombinase
MDELGGLTTLKRQMATRLTALDAKENQYLDLVGEPGWPKDKLRRKLDSIQAERSQLQDQLADASSRLDIGRAFFIAALALLRSPQEHYQRVGTSLKRAMNKLIFTKLYVDADEIGDHELADPVRDLVVAHQAHAHHGPSAAAAEPSSANSPALEEDEAATWLNLTGADLLGLTLAGQGSSRAALVEVPGIEPGSSVASSGLLRAQSATSLLGPTSLTD